MKQQWSLRVIDSPPSFQHPMSQICTQGQFQGPATLSGAERFAKPLDPTVNSGCSAISFKRSRPSVPSPQPIVALGMVSARSHCPP
jgi:hypothetical protein